MPRAWFHALPDRRQRRREIKSRMTSISPVRMCSRPIRSYRWGGAFSAKPEQYGGSRRDARAFVGACSSRADGRLPDHSDDRVRMKIIDTRVRFKHLSRSEIEAYIASREWRGKAGGYAIQAWPDASSTKSRDLHQRRGFAAHGSGVHAPRRRLPRALQLGGCGEADAE